ncbi:unnamed protein product [Peniophora sp. CBMAI 1063]|nr:unnamed protein product [Peniophora sp. CBMAI 1063]
MLAQPLVSGAVVGLMALGASALRTPREPRSLTPRVTLPSGSSGKGIQTRPVSSAVSSSDGSATGLANVNNGWYLTNITLGGSEFTVQLDTGSTDLVLYPDLPIKTSAVWNDYEINATYGTGWTAGPIAVAKLEFGGYTVESQAYLNGTSLSDWDKQYALPLGIVGIMGVALDSGLSWIHDELEQIYDTKTANEVGRSVLANVFDQHPTLDNFTVVYLGRSDDGEGSGSGYISVGEYYPEELEDYFDSIEAIKTFTPTDWTVPMDRLTVNGKSVALKSGVKGAPAGKAIADLDTGTGDAAVPKYVLDAMYGGISGAWYSDAFEAWIVPCLNDAPNITFNFGGMEYYIHPLDLTDVQDLRPDYNYTVCTSSFGELDFDQDELDLLLGDSFLRNVFTSFYYGDVDTKGNVVKSPSVKLLSASQGDEEDYADFLTRRRQNLASLPPEATKAQIQKAYPQTDSSSSDAAVSDAAVTSSSTDSSYQALLDKLDGFAPVIFGLLGGILVVLLGLLGVGIAMCIRRGRVVGAGRSVEYAPVRFKEAEGSYKDDENARYNQ